MVKTEYSPADIDLSAGDDIVHWCFEGEDIALCGRPLKETDNTDDDVTCLVCIELSRSYDGGGWWPEWWPEEIHDDQT